MDIVEFLDPQMAKKLFGKYVSELVAYQEQPNKLTETVGSVYPKIDNRASFVNALNERFIPWSTSEAGLVAISALLQMKMNAGGNPFPSAYIVKSILDSFNPLSGDAKSNELRKEIIFASWDPLYGSRLSGIFWLVVQGASSRGTFDPPLRFTMKALCERPEILGYPEGDQIAAQLAPLLAKATSDEDRDLVRDLMITIAAAGLPSAKSTVLGNLSSYWQNDSDLRIRRDVALAQSLAADDVLLQILANQTNAVTKELQAPGERTRERLQLISEFDKLVPGFLEGQLVAALSVTSESAYNFWEDIISSHRDRLSPQACSELINKALALVSATGEFNQRKPALLKLAAGLFSSQPTAELTALIRRVFELLWHPDDTIRNSAAENLPIIKATANQGDFRIYLNAGIHEHLNKVGMSTLRAYQPVIDVLIANKDLWMKALLAQ